MGNIEAETKLREMIYHFQRMKEMYGKDEEKFIFELEAFLVSARSIPDVLLEDYNKKFSLGIDLDERLNDTIFENKAREHQNSKALDFIQWWRSKKQELRKSKLGPILFTKRNISVHRKVLRPDSKEVTSFSTFPLTAYVTVEVRDKNGRIINRQEPPQTTLPSTEPKPPQIEWYFKDYPSKNILDISEEIVRVLVEFVEEAKTKFN